MCFSYCGISTLASKRYGLLICASHGYAGQAFVQDSSGLNSLIRFLPLIESYKNKLRIFSTRWVSRCCHRRRNSTVCQSNPSCQSQNHLPRSKKRRRTCCCQRRAKHSYPIHSIFPLPWRHIWDSLRQSNRARQSPKLEHTQGSNIFQWSYCCRLGSSTPSCTQKLARQPNLWRHECVGGRVEHYSGRWKETPGCSELFGPSRRHDSLDGPIRSRQNHPIEQHCWKTHFRNYRGGHLLWWRNLGQSQAGWAWLAPSWSGCGVFAKTLSSICSETQHDNLLFFLGVEMVIAWMFPCHLNSLVPPCHLVTTLLRPCWAHPGEEQRGICHPRWHHVWDPYAPGEFDLRSSLHPAKALQRKPQQRGGPTARSPLYVGVFP